MKTAKNEKSTPEKDDRSRHRAQAVAAGVSCALCVLSLAFTALDSPKYENDAVSAAITYSEPEKPADKGFWELFSEAVVYIFMTEG